MRKFLPLVLFIILAPILGAQQHLSVPLDSSVYELIDLGIIRGVISAPPQARPWSESTVKEKLQEMILFGPALGKISAAEVAVLEAAFASFSRTPGLDWQQGAFRAEEVTGSGSRFSFDAGLGFKSDSSFSTDLTPGAGLKSSFALGTVDMLNFYLDGDLGNHFSYGFNIDLGLVSIKRNDVSYVDKLDRGPDRIPGSGDEFDSDGNPVSDSAYFLPGYFPYTFTPVWDGPTGNFSGEHTGFKSWPYPWALGYHITSELSASFLDNRLKFQFARMPRDWGPGGMGTSLVLNAQNYPFVGLEFQMTPIRGIHLTTLSGSLEQAGLIANTGEYQNAFSAAMLELNLGKYVSLSGGAAVVWPKRFELGYIFPLEIAPIYQYSIGDYDNPSMFGNIVLQYPGLGRLWFSIDVDEMQLSQQSRENFFSLDRNMYAVQAGAKVSLPWLPFASLSLRYTKVEPYMYTHPRTKTPWYPNPMATGYNNNGYPVGYYLSPNSDEFFIRAESQFTPQAQAHVQYQLVRHGAEYGPGKVDGSSFLDVLPYAEDSIKSLPNDVLWSYRKYFLNDGAYSWQHIVKLGGTYRFASKLPLSLSLDAGLVITNYTGVSLSETDPLKATKMDSHPIKEGDPWYVYYKPSLRPILSLVLKVF
jgi:hypothetical protein